MQEKTEAVSEFAMKRTLAQQRQYLPIFAVRNEVSSFIYNCALGICNCSRQQGYICIPDTSRKTSCF